MKLFYLITIIWKCAMCMNHLEELNKIDQNVSSVRITLGKLYSQNSALLHKMRKLDDYIKRGTDMETRWVIEILGFPFKHNEMTPDDFMASIARAMGIPFKQRDIKGLRVLSAQKYKTPCIIAEMMTSKIKKLWTRTYKNKLFSKSLGNADKAFGSKETYKFYQHKALYLQDFIPDICKMYDLPAIRFSINDYISPYRKRILAYTKLLAAHYQWRFVWVSDGEIFLRKANKDPGCAIHSEKDLRVLDWRLENEDFFWKLLNECNQKRRAELKYTRPRYNEYVKEESDENADKEREDRFRKREFKKNFVQYKRKFDDEMKYLLADVYNLSSHDNFSQQIPSFNEGSNTYRVIGNTVSIKHFMDETT